MRHKLSLLKKRVAIVLEDDNKKGVFQILREAIGFWIAKKEVPYFYFGKFLYRKDVKNYKDYLSSKEVDLVTLSKKLHRTQYASILRNKLSFAIYMEKNKMAVPPLIGYNFGNRFFYQENNKTITDKEDLTKFFKDLFEVTGKTKIFIKAISEMGGKGCHLLTFDNYKEEIEKNSKEILTNDFIWQDIIVQHDEVNKIYPSSVNTIRFDSYLDKNDKVHILSAFMRFGGGGAVVDNNSSGGFFVPIDLEKGRLKEKSHQQLKYGGKRLTAHPDTNTVFSNFEIPFFEEACALVKSAVDCIPDRIIGWDIAITPEGPVIVEGNDNNSFIAPDIAYGGYLSHPMFKEIMQEA